MIYLLYGDDKYRRDSFFSNLKSRIQIDNDSMNYTTHRGTFDFGKIVMEATTMPFLAAKRLIVLDGALKSKDKNFLDSLGDWLKNAPDYCEMVFLEEDQPDKRLKVTKALEKISEIHDFRSMNPIEVINFIKKRVTESGGTITDKAARDLQFACGSDLNSVTNEIKKLINYDKNITEESVDLLVDAGYFNRIFDLTDAISSKNPTKSLFHLSKLISIGEEPLAILGMIGSQFRNLLLVQDLQHHGLSESEIQSRSKLHQFVVKKSLAQIHRFTREELLQIHKEIINTDLSIKQSLGDPEMLLQLLVLKISKKEA